MFIFHEKIQFFIISAKKKDRLVRFPEAISLRQYLSHVYWSSRLSIWSRNIFLVSSGVLAMPEAMVGFPSMGQ